MKLTLSLSLLLAAKGFTTQPRRAHAPTQLAAKEWGAAASAVAGWTLATQLATAVVPPANYLPDNMIQEQPSVTVAVETLDFSMPSYGDSVKSSAKAKAEAPSFNPFGDFEPTMKSDEDKAVEEAKKAEEKAAAEQKKADEKAAVEARKAEQKAAADAKKAEEKAAANAKKAEEKAKKEAEKAAAADAKKADKADAPAAPLLEIPDFKAPDIDIPDFKAPDIKVPDFKAPDIKVPDFKAPKFSLDASKLGLDNIKMPDAPKIDTGSLGLDKIKIPDTPKLDASGYLDNIKVPDAPKIDTSGLGLDKVNLPKVSLPSFGGGDSSSDDPFLESQDVRDSAAAAARSVFLDADAEAKEKEEIARQFRAKANEKKADAKVAKDAACKTRPGGKLLCLRNPFKLGY